MKIGIIGLPGSGKMTVFEALTGNISSTPNKSESRVGIVRVPDSRIDALSEMYKPRKTTYAQVEYFLPGKSDTPGSTSAQKTGQKGEWLKARDCDALIHVVRNFELFGEGKPDSVADFRKLDQELVLADLMVVEKRLERIDQDRKRGKPPETEEAGLIEACRKHLEQEIPLRRFPELAGSHLLKGYAFLSGKSTLVLFNNGDEDENLPDISDRQFEENCIVIRGRLEQELAQMSPGEAEVFLAEFNISASAADRVIRKSYELMGLISFFTTGEDEVRAWTIRQGTSALDAAEVIHSDIKKGFIRAEVISYTDLMDAGTYAEARKRGTVRLEGKTYTVQDGDIIHFRFNV